MNPVRYPSERNLLFLHCPSCLQFFSKWHHWVYDDGFSPPMRYCSETCRVSGINFD
jgi:hypothetical protein